MIDEVARKCAPKYMQLDDDLNFYGGVFYIMSIVNFPQNLCADSAKESLRYGVYTANEKAPNGHPFARSFIVIKDEFGNITRFTHLEDYAQVYSGKNWKPIYADAEKRLHHVCKMLNYIIVDCGLAYGVKDVFGITKPMMRDYFNHYALTPKPDGSPISEDSVVKCIHICTAFMYSLYKRYGKDMSVKGSELYRDTVVSGKNGGSTVIKTPDFKAEGYDDGITPLLRDIPTGAVCMLISLGYKYDPGIVFPIVAQCTAGLRPGEAMNMRRPDSPLGPGVTFTRVNGKTSKIEIDLSKRLTLRSDEVITGNIKRPRTQRVYTPFIPLFEYAYDRHMKMMEEQDYEEEYGPMFVNGKGLAMTYDNYSARLDVLIREHLRPTLLDSSDPSLRLFGQMLCENHFRAHGFRHFFSCQLALNGECLANIQSWRGDKNSESALWYLKNKGELLDKMRLVNDWLASLLLNLKKEEQNL